jgi:hypothetical protein
VNLASLTLSSDPALGYPGTRQIRLLQQASSATQSAIATQAATDFYNWQIAQTPDLSFDHVAPWVPCGIEDSIEWAETYTRVQRPPWNDRREVVRPIAATGNLILVRLTGFLGDSCNYLDGYTQKFTFAQASGSGSGSGSGNGFGAGCLVLADDQEIDIFDANALPASGSGSGGG